MSCSTLLTVCTPTIWLVGVTSGIWPSSLRHARQFLVDVVDPVERIHFAQLADEVREHAARRLVQQHVDVDDRDLESSSRCLYFGITCFSRTSLIAASLRMSKPVSRSVPISVITSGSMAGCEVR